MSMNWLRNLGMRLGRSNGQAELLEPAATAGAPGRPVSVETAADALSAAELKLVEAELAVATLSDVRAKIGEEPVIVAINRSIFTLELTEAGAEVQRPPGGAAGALYGALRGAGGGVIVSTATTELERRLAKGGLLVSPGDNVWVQYLYVPDEVFNLFYNEFANPALWLIQHEMGDAILPRPGPRDFLRHSRAWIAYRLPWVKVEAIHRIIFTHDVDRAYRDGYQSVNRQYAESLISSYGDLPRARILIQDYHFYLLPKYLRELGSEALLHHFIHIPWVSPHYLQRVMPESLWRELLDSLLQNDIIGFQIPRYCHDFLAAARSLLDAETDFANGLVTYKGRTTLVQNYPISVDVGQLRHTALAGDEGAMTLAYVEGLRRKVGRKLLILRADRVDLSKGIIEGFAAVDLMLRRQPRLRGQVQMLALLQRSRLDVPEYRNLYDQIISLVREINRRWTPDETWDGIVDSLEERLAFAADLQDPSIRAWPPLVVDFTDKPFPEVVGAQIAADICLVNPLADGMNLVAKEFAVNNKPSFIREFNQRLRQKGTGAVGAVPGIIVGSLRMGAYPELRDGLLPVDPRSVDETAEALSQAWRLQATVRGLDGSSGLRDRLPSPLRRLRRHPLLPEGLADRAAEQVSRSTITDWMDKIMLDVELCRDPHWRQVVQESGLRLARGAIERGSTLEEAFPTLV